MAPVLLPDDLVRTIQDLRDRITRLERTSDLNMAPGSLQVPVHQPNTNVVAGSINGMMLFTGTADPAASAIEGDLWFKDGTGGVWVRRSNAWTRVA